MKCAWFILKQPHPSLEKLWSTKSVPSAKMIGGGATALDHPTT